MKPRGPERLIDPRTGAAYRLTTDPRRTCGRRMLVRIVEEERARGGSLAEVARRLGVAPSRLQHIAAGENAPAADLAARLQIVCGIPAHLWAVLDESPRSEIAT